MGISQITLLSFRNHEKKDLNFNEGLTVIWGDNGSGKTSILEALHVLSYGKSFKTSKRKQLIKKGFPFYVVRGVFTTNGVSETINTEYRLGGVQKTKINGKLITSRSQQVRRNPVVILSPEEQEITKGGPLNRRRFFDRAFSVVSLKYLTILQEYSKILKQRNALLINIRDGEAKTSSVSIWDEQLVSSATKLYKQKEEMFKDFSRIMNRLQNYYEHDVQIEVRYSPSVSEVSEYKNILKSTKKADVLSGRTNRGPHRDNIKVCWGGDETRVVGSQGEHKLTLVFLKLAEMMLVKEKTGSFPILLLDDLFAKLDLERSKKLVRLINQLESKTDTAIQTIITTTDVLNIEQSGILNDNQNPTSHHLVR